VSDGDPGYIIYRGRLAASGEAADDLAPGLRFFPIDDLPFDAIGERDIVACSSDTSTSGPRTGLASM
jgi:hypothetical protein